MNYDLVDKKLDTFKKYQVAILRTGRRDYMVYSLVTMIVATGIMIYFTTHVHNRHLSFSDAVGIFLMFPGFILIAILSSFLAFLKNRNRTATFEMGCIVYRDKRYSGDSILFIELLGPLVLNVQLKGMKSICFVSDTSERNRLIYDEIKQIKTNIPVKRHIMGKPFLA